MNIKTIPIIACLASLAAGESDTFTLGDLGLWLVDVVGFYAIDATAAVFDIIRIIFILFVARILWTRLKPTE